LIDTRAGRLAVSAVICAALLVACSKSQPTSAPSRSSGAVPSRSSTAADPLPAAIADVMNTYTTLENVRAIIVNVDGRPRFERYFSSTADESRSSYSVTKSVTSTLVGIAISEGRLRLDESLSQMLPRYAAEMKPSVARVTLRQLLTHTAGFTDTFSADETGLLASPDWVRYILKHQNYAPGAEFHYSDYWRASAVADPCPGDRRIGVGLRPDQTVRSARNRDPTRRRASRHRPNAHASDR
jgi:CubicO group peptidase (beta-lactamase class C family)